MAGMVLGIHFPDPQHIAVVFNIKQKTEALKYVERNEIDFKKENPYVDFQAVVSKLKNSRRIPPQMWKWLWPRWQKESIDPKHDHYGLPAGKMEQYWRDKYPNDYFDYDMAEEFVEETGKKIVREIKTNNDKIIRISLFKRVIMLYEKDRENEKVDYENHFFHILEADGEWNKEGCPEETEAPEIVPIIKLFPPKFRPWPLNGIDFYPKHALGLKICLRQLMREQSKEEYLPALKHIEKFFPREAKDVGLFEEIKDTEPTFDLTDEEVWLRATQGIKKI